MTRLRLAAADTEDLQVLSARLQDAVLKLRDMSWQPKKRRFAVVVNRLQWEEGGKTRVLELADVIGRATNTLIDRIYPALTTLIERASSDSVVTLLQNIIVTGGGSQIRGIDTLLQKKLTEARAKQSNVQTRLESANNRYRLREMYAGPKTHEAFSRFDIAPSGSSGNNSNSLKVLIVDLLI